MEVKLNRETIDSFKNILDTSVTYEETMEMIVPDALPDIYKIVDSEGTILIRSKEADTGKASVSGIVSVSVLYCPESESGIRKLDVPIPFNAFIDCPEINTASRLVVSASIAKIDSRMLNPRKILVRVDILIRFKGFQNSQTEVCTSLMGETNGIETLSETANVSTVNAIKEKSFVLTDSFTLPSSNPPIEEILKSRVNYTCDDIKAVGNKLIFKGTAFIGLTYRSDKDGDVYTAELTASFSQIMEMESASEGTRYEMQLFPTGIYFEPDTTAGSDRRNITVEMHLVAQAIAINKRELNYISDLYSTAYEIKYETEAPAFNDFCTPTTIRETIRDMLKTSDDVSRIIDIHYHCGKVMSNISNDTLQMTVPITVYIMYKTDNGKINGISGSFEASAETAADSNSKYSIHAVVLPESLATADESGIMVRIAVEFCVYCVMPRNLFCIKSISCDENTMMDFSINPSVVLKRLYGGESLWLLAKTYNSTTKLISEANLLENETELYAGRILIIPKKR